MTERGKIRDPIRLARMVKDIAGALVKREILFTIQASWMGPIGVVLTRFLALHLVHHPREADGVVPSIS